jgi:predicted GIY-YIG superfamily endonuclease
MENFTITEHNLETSAVVQRDMNSDELAYWTSYKNKIEAEAAESQAKAEARATQKAALLDRLGITEDEAKLLLA